MLTLEAKPEWVESVSQLGFTERANRRMQWLMDQNNDGQLCSSEKEELTVLVEMSESISIVRAEALRMLGRQP